MQSSAAPRQAMSLLIISRWQFGGVLHSRCTSSPTICDRDEDALVLPFRCCNAVQLHPKQFAFLLERAGILVSIQGKKRAMRLHSPSRERREPMVNGSQSIACASLPFRWCFQAPQGKHLRASGSHRPGRRQLKQYKPPGLRCCTQRIGYWLAPRQ